MYTSLCIKRVGGRRRSLQKNPERCRLGCLVVTAESERGSRHIIRKKLSDAFSGGRGRKVTRPLPCPKPQLSEVWGVSRPRRLIRNACGKFQMLCALPPTIRRPLFNHARPHEMPHLPVCFEAKFPFLCSGAMGSVSSSRHSHLSGMQFEVDLKRSVLNTPRQTDRQTDRSIPHRLAALVNLKSLRRQLHPPVRPSIRPRDKSLPVKRLDFASARRKQKTRQLSLLSRPFPFLFA